MTKRVIVTIDGPSGAGKSTVARLLARRLRMMYLDTGATYRSLAYAALHQKVSLEDVRALLRLSRAMDLAIDESPTGSVHVWLNGADVSRAIRTERVTKAAAVVAQIPEVRRAMVRLQRRLAKSRRVVVEGRDTGSVVFPNAQYKFFVTASTAVRARRRRDELKRLEGSSLPLAVVARSLRARDRLDRRRKVGPLVCPPKAIRVDTSYLPVEQVVERMLSHVPRA